MSETQKVSVNLNLDKNSILNSVISTAVPENPVEGMYYLDEDLGRVKIYHNGEWTSGGDIEVASEEILGGIKLFGVDSEITLYGFKPADHDDCILYIDTLSENYNPETSVWDCSSEWIVPDYILDAKNNKIHFNKNSEEEFELAAYQRGDYFLRQIESSTGSWFVYDSVNKTGSICYIPDLEQFDPTEPLVRFFHVIESDFVYEVKKDGSVELNNEDRASVNIEDHYYNKSEMNEVFSVFNDLITSASERPALTEVPPASTIEIGGMKLKESTEAIVLYPYLFKYNAETSVIPLYFSAAHDSIIDEHPVWMVETDTHPNIFTIYDENQKVVCKLSWKDIVGHSGKIISEHVMLATSTDGKHFWFSTPDDNPVQDPTTSAYKNHVYLDNSREIETVNIKPAGSVELDNEDRGFVNLNRHDVIGGKLIDVTNDGIVNNLYELPVASVDELGGIKLMDNGEVDVTYYALRFAGTCSIYASSNATDDLRDIVPNPDWRPIFMQPCWEIKPDYKHPATITFYNANEYSPDYPEWHTMDVIASFAWDETIIDRAGQVFDIPFYTSTGMKLVVSNDKKYFWFCYMWDKNIQDVTSEDAEPDCRIERFGNHDKHIFKKPRGAVQLDENDCAYVDLNDTTYSAGSYIDISKDGVISCTAEPGMTLETGEAFIENIKPDEENKFFTSISSAAYGNGIFLIVGKNTSSGISTFTSNDGKNWEAHENVIPYPNADLYSVGFDGTNFVILTKSTGNYNYVTSPNGINWISYKPSYFPMQDWAYNFACSTNGDSYITIKNNIHCTTRLDGDESCYNKIPREGLGSDSKGNYYVGNICRFSLLWGRDRYACISGNSILESFDGITWNIKDSVLGDLYYDNKNDIYGTYSNGIFAWMKKEGSKLIKYVVETGEVTTYDNPIRPGKTSPEYCKLFTSDGKRFILWSANEYDGGYAFFHSEDLENWEIDHITKANVPLQYEPQIVAANNGMNLGIITDVENNPTSSILLSSAGSDIITLYGEDVTDRVKSALNVSVESATDEEVQDIMDEIFN